MKQISTFISENIVFNINNINERKENNKLSKLKKELDDLTQQLADAREKEGEKLRNKINPIFDKYWNIIEDICKKYDGTREDSFTEINSTPANAHKYSIFFRLGCFYEAKINTEEDRFEAVNGVKSELQKILKEKNIDYIISVFDNGWVNLYIEDKIVRKANNDYNRVIDPIFNKRTDVFFEYENEFKESEEYNKLYRRVTKEIKQALNSDNAQEYFYINDIDRIEEYMECTLIPNIPEFYKAIKNFVKLKGKYWILINGIIDFEDLSDTDEITTADSIIPGDYNPGSADMTYNQCKSAFDNHPNLAQQIIHKLEEFQ